ncbi:MAG: zinc ABC transporter substrate-binding protein [Firmicutes bacterium]|nr:zinc ABC transporter substrate-binding protein [Bacillota bacterium]
MKKLLSLVLLMMMLASLYPGASLAEASKLKVVTTIFPPYDFVRAIAGDAVELTMLLPPGSESHSFEPTPRDIIAIQNCDVFIYTGGEADVWVDRILASMDTSNMTLLPMLDMVDAVEEVIVEGMEEEEDAHEEAEVFDPGLVRARPLSDWEGAWKSLAPMLRDDSLDEYLRQYAEERELTLDEARAKRAEAWKTDDLPSFSIEGDTLTVNGQEGTHSAKYSDAGYALVEGDHGTSVWYQYQIMEPAAPMPSYLLFNDHQIGNADASEHDEESVPHTHLRYGNAGFEELLDAEGWSPYYVAEYAAADEILKMLAGHGHSEAELDEHVWTSPQNAKRIVLQIADTLSALDPSRADLFAQNAAAYAAELDALDQAFRQVVNGAVRETVVFGDRFPFRYLADAYGLTYYAAFPGCATETEASAATIKFLIDKVNEEKIPVVFTIELSNGKIADAIAESTGAVKLELHSAHNLSKSDFEKNVGYLELMRQNVEKLKEALN